MVKISKKGFQNKGQNMALIEQIYLNELVHPLEFLL